MDYLSKIDSQLLVLRDFLYQQITSDYVYLDVPGHMNVGDQLIAMGAWCLLDELPYKCVYRSTIRAFDFKMPENVIVLLHGGGNFGDLYPGANWFRNEIVQKFPNHKIVFLPQTITYKDNALIEKDAEVCSHHENLHICARDMNSYHLLERYFSRNNIYLVPDTAWGLYDFLKKHSVDDNVGKSMLMKRKDFEIGKEWNICADDVKDWDDILHEINIDCKFLIYRVLNKLGRKVQWPCFFKLSDSFLMNVLYPSILKKVNEYFLKYKMIYSTRLHGFIFSVMLHLPVEWQDTKYGKLSGYYETWFGEK